MPELFRIKSEETVDCIALSQSLGLEELTVRALAMRGINTEDGIKRFLNPSVEDMHSPLLLSDMDLACARISQAMEQGEKITVYGDYDVDGVCAVSILLTYFTDNNANVDYYIPSRHDEGYGLNQNAIQTLCDAGTRLIITVDCGVTSVNEVEFAKKLGMDVIITDHHELPEILPDCPVVCPKLADYPFNALCGAGVAFKLVSALQGEILDGRYFQLAAIATVADIVPLVDENRIIVYYGLQEINHQPTTGIKELIDVSGVNGQVRAGDISYYIAPRINAAGRMDIANVCVSLMMTKDVMEAKRIASELNELNLERQQLCEEITKSALEQLNNDGIFLHRRCIILSGPWKHGVIGIVASKLTERFHRPVFLFEEKDGICTGSARSIKSVNLMDVLHATADLLTKYGGHHMAAGVTMPKENMVEFKARVGEYLDEMAADGFMPTASYDGVLEIRQINRKLNDEIIMLEPYGCANPEPCFRIEGATVSNYYSIGKTDAHLKMLLTDGKASTSMTAFNYNHAWQRSLNHSDVDAIVTLDRWMKNNVLTLQLKCRVIRQKNYKETLISGIESNFYGIYNAYFRQNLYNIKTSSDAAHITVDIVSELEGRCRESAYGALVLVMNPQRCKELIEKLPQGILDIMDVSVGSPISDNGGNSIVFGPYFDRINWRMYTHIYIYDLPGEWNGDALASHIEPEHKVYINNAVENSLITPFDFSKDVMKKYYLALKKNDLGNRDAACRAMESEWPENGICGAEAALAVFIELGFVIIENEKVKMQKTPPSDLFSSTTYCGLHSFFNKDGVQND